MTSGAAKAALYYPTVLGWGARREKTENIGRVILPSGYLLQFAMEAMAHRNRWFTYQKGLFSMAMLNNQMVYFKHQKRVLTH